MKKFLSILLFFVLLMIISINVASAQTCNPPLIAVEPPTLDFGAVDINSTKQSTFRVKYLRNRTVTFPLDCKFVGGCFDTDPICECNCGTPETITVQLSLNSAFYSLPTTSFTISSPDTYTGSAIGYVDVPVNFTPLNELVVEIDVTISATSLNNKTVHLLGRGIEPQPNIDLYPISMNFGQVSVGDVYAGNMTVSNVGSAQLNVFSISTEAPFSVNPSSFTVAPGSLKNVSISFTPTSVTEYSGQVTVNSNDPDAGKLIVNVAGSGKGADMKFSSVIEAGSIDWGGVIINTSKSISLPVQNTGNEDLVISNIAADNGLFVPTISSLVVAPGNTQNIDVLYNPTVIQADAGNLNLLTNDPNQPDVNVGLKGIGLADLDIVIDEIELNQGNPEAHTKLTPSYLVAGKATAVRVYVSGYKNDGSKVPVSGVDGILRVYRYDQEITGSPYLSNNGPVFSIAADNSQRAQTVDGTLNFIFNNSEAGDYLFEVEINPESGARVARIDEHNYDNNISQKSGIFFSRYEPTIAYIPISHLSWGLPYESVIGKGAGIMKSMYPLSGLHYLRLPPITYDYKLVHTTSKGAYDSWKTQNSFNILSGKLFLAAHLATEVMPDKVFGWLPYIPHDERAGVYGMSNVSSRVAVGYATVYAQDDFAHEIGHAYGLCHTHSTDCTSLDEKAGEYRDGHECNGTDNRCDEISIEKVGIDPYTMEIKTAVSSDDYYGCQNKDGYVDFMAYWGPFDEKDFEYICEQAQASGKWINPQRYQFLFDRLKSKYSDWAYHSGCKKGTTSSTICMTENISLNISPVWIVRGSLNEDGIFLAPVYETEGVSDLSDENEEDAAYANYTLRLVSEDDQAIFEKALYGDESNIISFNFAVPYDDLFQRIQVLEGDAIIAEKVRSINIPEITTIEASVSGENLSINWSAEDIDEEELVFTVLYSRNDGTTFVPIAIDTKEESLNYVTKYLGGSDQALVRVMVSDGINSSYVDSNLFSIEKKMPEVKITKPRQGETVYDGSSVILEAIVNDAEDLSIEDDSILWASDKSGELGNGASLFVNYIEEGEHIISVTVTDSDGMQAQDEIALHVVDGALAPRADAGEYQEVVEGDIVHLNGTKSTTLGQEETLDFMWEQISGPQVDVNGVFDAVPSFVSPQVDGDSVLEFRLAVKNANNITDTAFTKVVVKNEYYPMIMLDQDKVEFDETAIGSSSSYYITITNGGNEVLTIKDVKSSSPAFSVSNKAFALGVGESKTIELEFTPEEKALYKAMIEVVTENAVGANVILLEGKAIDAEIVVDQSGGNQNMTGNWPDNENDLNSAASSSDNLINNIGGSAGCNMLETNSTNLATLILTILAIYFFRRRREI